MLLMLSACSTAVPRGSGWESSVTLSGKVYAGGLVIPVRIDGKKFHMLVDTGADVTVLRRDLVRQTWPKRRELKPQVPLGDKVLSRAGLMPVQRLQLGGQEIPLRMICVLDISHLGALEGEPIAGLLGMDVLRQCRMLFDVPHRQVSVLSRVPSAEALRHAGAIELPIEMTTPYAMATLDLDGQRYSCIVDTGTSKTAIRKSEWKGKILRSSVPMLVNSVNGLQKKSGIEFGPVEKLQWGGMRVSKTTVDLTTSTPSVVGSDLMAKRAVLMDFPSGRIWSLEE
jgi:predicted aspartyl protease